MSTHQSCNSAHAKTDHFLHRNVPDAGRQSNEKTPSAKCAVGAVGAEWVGGVGTPVGSAGS